MLGVEGAVSECLSGFLVQHILKVLVVPGVDLLYLVGGTEAVEEVEYGNSSLDSGEVSYRAEIHDLLNV